MQLLVTHHLRVLQAVALALFEPAGFTNKARLGDSFFERQSEILMTEAVTVNSPSHEEDFDEVGCNADLYFYII